MYNTCRWVLPRICTAACSESCIALSTKDEHLNRHQCSHHTQTDKKCPNCLYKCTKNVQMSTYACRATRGTQRVKASTAQGWGDTHTPEPDVPVPVPGGTLPRYAERRSAGELANDPPRTTRTHAPEVLRHFPRDQLRPQGRTPHTSLAPTPRHCRACRRAQADSVVAASCTCLRHCLRTTHS